MNWLGEALFNKYTYNHLLASSVFWSSFPTERILLFEMDTILCDNPTRSIESFLQFDYVGAPWSRIDCGGPDKWMKKCVGNSGFSLWSKKMMMDFLSEETKRKWIGQPNANNNDLWMAKNLQDVMNANVANLDDARYFSVEQLYDGTYTPVSMHKPWMYLSKEMLAKLYEKCPNIKKIGPKI